VGEFPLRIKRVSKSGDGVGDLEGRSVFVPGALPGELVVVALDPNARSPLRAEIRRILEPSSKRRSPMCPIVEACGGCSWMHVDDAYQLELKQEIVVSALSHLARISRDAYALLPSVQSPSSLRYRRRATLHVEKGSLGFFAQRTHAHVPVPRCLVLTEALDGLLVVLNQSLAGVLKEVEEVRLLEGEGLVAASFHGKLRPSRRFVDAIERLVSEGALSGAAFVQPGKDSVTLDIGRPVLREGRTRCRPDAFAQGNAAVNAALVQHVVETVASTPTLKGLELYCGNGNFSFELARRAQEIVAVESSRISSALGQQGDRGDLSGVLRFIQGDSGKVCAGLIKERRTFDWMVLDPPRTGAMGCADWALKLGTTKVVYVGCDPAALARDAGALQQRGFRPVSLRLFDMFPQTHHIEAVMSFAR
jgi:23S rRNA (uracil1939-C5)-methyltransferase